MFSDFTLTNAIQIALVLGSVGATIITLRVTVKFLKAEFAELKTSTKTDIAGIQSEIKQIGEILIKQADMRGEIKVLENRVSNAEQDLRDMKLRCEREHRIHVTHAAD